MEGGLVGLVDDQGAAAEALADVVVGVAWKGKSEPKLLACLPSATGNDPGSATPSIRCTHGPPVDSRVARMFWRRALELEGDSWCQEVAEGLSWQNLSLQ